MFKYPKPLDTQRLFVPAKISLDRIELEITFQCNLGCFHCSRRIPQAPSEGLMTLDQIEHFVVESAHPWERVVLSGGEPMLHKDILQIVDLILPVTKKLIVATNGHGVEVNRILQTLPRRVEIHNSNKQNNEIRGFVNVDTTCLEFSKGSVDVHACYVPEHCGILLNRHGYYCCVLAGGIDRTLRLGIAIPVLSSVSEDTLIRQMSIICQYCGHSQDAPGGAYGDIPKSPFKYISPFWAEAYKRHLADPYTLPTY